MRNRHGLGRGIFKQLHFLAQLGSAALRTIFGDLMPLLLRPVRQLFIAVEAALDHAPLQLISQCLAKQRYFRPRRHQCNP
jgi:hypothetical protein